MHCIHRDKSTPWAKSLFFSPKVIHSCTLAFKQGILTYSFIYYYYFIFWKCTCTSRLQLFISIIFESHAPTLQECGTSNEYSSYMHSLMNPYIFFVLTSYSCTYAKSSTLTRPHGSHIHVHIYLDGFMYLFILFYAKFLLLISIWTFWSLISNQSLFIRSLIVVIQPLISLFT